MRTYCLSCVLAALAAPRAAQDNYKEFEKKKGDDLKKLVALLSSENATVLAVACHDIAEFVKAHPDGRRLMMLHGAKAPAMSLLKHHDPEVQKYARTAVQRLRVINWEDLGGKPGS